MVLSSVAKAKEREEPDEFPNVDPRSKGDLSHLNFQPSPLKPDNVFRPTQPTFQFRNPYNITPAIPPNIMDAPHPPYPFHFQPERRASLPLDPSFAKKIPETHESPFEGQNYWTPHIGDTEFHLDQDSLIKLDGNDTM